MSEEFNEELLLQSPEKDATSEVPMEENEDIHGIATEQKVRVLRKKSKDVVKVTNKSITAMVVECDKVLSRSFRTTDPIRNEVMESVERQAKVAKETTKISLEQFTRDWEEMVQNIPIGERGDIENGVIEILKVANLTQTHQLGTCLDERIADREYIQVLGDIVGCPSSNSVEQIRLLVEKLNEKERNIERLTQQIEQQNVQIQELTSRIGHFDFGGLESYDPHVLLAIARKKLQLDKGSAHVFVGHRKRALVTFETLPKDVREGSFEEVVAAMQECLQEDGNSARIKALHQLRNLSLRNDQSVGEFCVVLEKIAHRAFPDTPAEAVSLQKAEILFRQLANWNGSYSLSEAIETSKSGEAYENVKKAALRLEMNRKAVVEMSEGSIRKTTPNSQSSKAGNNRFQRFNNINSDSGRFATHVHPRVTSEATRHNGRNSSGRDATQSKSRNTVVDRSEVECYSCGKRGHMAKDCRSKTSRRRDEDTRPRVNNEHQAGSFSALVDNLVASVSMSKEYVETQGHRATGYWLRDVDCSVRCFP
ncbi:zinc knuckle [Ancylostoma caninum]|uniref:Zinc knuckle n=1 Tax=Ancylostoma caninum TaxID=29170 RepID=A0A368H0X3_ANCCA|nr:zinc knuckle [Ancylostoma caninum]